MNSQKVKKFCQQFDPTCRVRSINGQRNKKKVTHYIQAWFTTNKPLRVQALGIIYGGAYDVGNNALAGNVRENHISMSPAQWAQLIVIDQA